MTIEIHQPELEALIHQRIATGRFRNIEDALLSALRSSPEKNEQTVPKPPKIDFSQFLIESPLWDSGLEVERNKDLPRPVDL